MNNACKKPIPSKVYPIPSFIFDKDVTLTKNKNHIIAISSFKKTVFISNLGFENQVYLPFWELEEINKLVKGQKDGNN